MKLKTAGLTLLAIAILTIGIFFSFARDNKNSTTSNNTSNESSESAKVLGASTQDEQPEVSIKKISVPDAKELINNNKENSQFKVIDIRTPEEYAAGDIDGSVNIDFYGSNFQQEISQLDKNGKYLVYCKTGGRSTQSMQVFEQLGFKDVYNLEGGYNAWIAQ